MLRFGPRTRFFVAAGILLTTFACASAPRKTAEPPEWAEADRLFEQAMAAAEVEDAPRAFELMQQAAAIGEPEAISALASFLDMGFGTTPDPVRSRALFEQAAALGSVAARLNLGLKLVWSDVPAEQVRAVEMLEALYESPPEDAGGESLRGSAAGGLALAHLFGLGVEKNLKRGVEMLEVADRADVSTPQGDFLLGRTYENGWGGRKADPERSYPHFLASAKAEFAGAYWKVGMALLEGWGTPRDEAAAYQWVRRSADSGDPRGEISLAVMLALGQGVEENDVEARDWYARGVARNLAHALRGLGVMMLTGEGGPTDRPRGWAYLTLAADAGESTARRAVEQLGASVSASDREAAAALASEWIAKHGPPRPMEE